MLIHVAIGDAYGAGFEYVSSEAVLSGNKLTNYATHPKYDLGNGRYTDDTQMSIAVAECILSGEPLTEEEFADAFVRCFKRDERVGYAGGFYKFLQSVENGDEFLARIKPNSDKSGAAMRAVPLGVLGSIEQVVEVATAQSRVTHDTPAGINAAVATALGAHYFAHELGKKSGLARFVEEHVDGDWTSSWSGPVGDKGWMAVQAAFTAIAASNSLADVLQRSISFTGDVDTVAAIALGIASQSDEFGRNLPAFLLNDMENGEYGREYIQGLDRRLAGILRLTKG